MRDVKAVGETIVQAVKEFVRRARDELTARIDQVAEQLAADREAMIVKHAALEAAIAQIPAGAPGADGRDGVDGKDGANGIDGKDGVPGRDGIDGRDALELQIIDIDAAKSYPRGVVALYRGGLIRATRKTTPITGDLAAAGWQVICRGVASTEIALGEDLRTLAVRVTHTDGEIVEQTLKSPSLIYREIYREGRDYERGDAVTFGGSLWIAQCDTTAKPGDGETWRLAVKKGRDGKDGTK